VVEHDPEIMKSADYLIDLGPRAGENGGEVIFQGSYPALLKDSKSLTSRYLSGELKISVPWFRRKSQKKSIEIVNAYQHNLKHLNVRIPLGILACITGVSGSGKSTLVHDVLYSAVKRAKGEIKESPGGFDAIRGSEHISDVILVDQSPIGRTPRSNPATYTKAFDDIREIFAETRDAGSRGFGPGHFSFNLETGRCPHCQGSGAVIVEMQFLADVELVCEDCKGTRFKNSVLEVRYKSKNIAEVLNLTVHEAMEFFAGKTSLIRKLRVLEEIGLGYLRLGQSATSLSGGEAQRIKLAAFISRATAGNALFVFDEPTTGLHFDDIRKLLAAFDKLISAGNSLLVIEHNLEVIKTADWIIDLGPEGGEAGGQIVCEGTPEDVAMCGASHTGRLLQAYLN
jgi:excinuclease ABC subunit A